MFQYRSAIFRESTNKCMGDTYHVFCFMICIFILFYFILLSAYVGQYIEYTKMNILSNTKYSFHVRDICCIISHCGYLYLRFSWLQFYLMDL